MDWNNSHSVSRARKYFEPAAWFEFLVDWMVLRRVDFCSPFFLFGISDRVVGLSVVAQFRSPDDFLLFLPQSGSDLWSPLLFADCSHLSFVLSQSSPETQSCVSDLHGFILELSSVSFPEFSVSIWRPDASRNELQNSASQKLLVFLEPSVKSYLVNLNDPFLRGPVLAVESRKQNEQLKSSFPGYQPVYFGLDDLAVFGKSKSSYRFYSAPKPIDGFSFFELAMAIQTARDVPDQDFFDLAYQGLFSSANSAVWWNFANAESQKMERENSQRRNFHSALIHSARLLLLPKLAFEQKGNQWESVFDCNRFLSELKQGDADFHSAGDIGETCSEQLKKVMKRIDSDSDGDLTCKEVNSFLQRKIQILRGE
jgi:hypothetical protein